MPERVLSYVTVASILRQQIMCISSLLKKIILLNRPDKWFPSLNRHHFRYITTTYVYYYEEQEQTDKVTRIVNDPDTQGTHVIVSRVLHTNSLPVLQV